MNATDYPQIEKLKKVSGRAQEISRFFDWLRSEKGYLLAHHKDDSPELFPVYPNVERLLAEYYEIDLEALERERRSLRK